MSHADLAAQLELIHPECFAWAMACCGNRHAEAEDVLQDTYMGVLANGLRFKGASSFRTWVFGIIRNKARARDRRERVRRWLGVHNAARLTPPPASLPDDDAIAAERRDRTRRALHALSARQREVLLLVFYHDLTVEEAAQVMRVSAGSARTHYARGKERMATLLNGMRP